MKVTLSTGVAKEILPASSDGKGVWFQNFSTTAGIYVFPVKGEEAVPSAPTEEFFLASAESATKPSTRLIQATGGDTTLVNRQWKAYQASGGNLDIFVGKW